MLAVCWLILTRVSVLSQWLLLPVVHMDRVGPDQRVQHSEEINSRKTKKKKRSKLSYTVRLEGWNLFLCMIAFSFQDGRYSRFWKTVIP